MAIYAAESSRLLLQTLSEDLHLEGVHLLMSNAGSMAWSTKSLHTDIQQTKELISASLPTSETPWNERWAILLKGEDGSRPKMIGLIGVVREQEIGYRIHPDFWRRGFMTEAISLFIQMFWTAEGNKQYNRLIAAADTENIASLKTLRKAGFQEDEIREKFYERGSQPGIKSDLQFFHLDRPIH